MFETQLNQIPQNPPRAELLPGLRMASVLPKSALLLPFFFLAFFAVIPLSVLHSDPAMRLALGPTKTSQGAVVSATNTACRGAAARRLVYAFSAEQGGEFRGSATLCEGALYYTATVGDSVQVQYLAADPAVNTLRGMPNNAPPLAMFLVMPLFLLAFIFSLFLPQVRELLKARTLFRRGRLASGEVLFVKKRASSYRMGWPGNASYEVFIEYESANGRREAAAWCANEWLVNQLAPGAKVHIACSEDEPGKVALLEAFLR
jgi:hypothetical protein